MATPSARLLQHGARRYCAAAATTATKAFSTSSSTRLAHATRPTSFASTVPAEAAGRAPRTRFFSSTAWRPAEKIMAPIDPERDEDADNFEYDDDRELTEEEAATMEELDEIYEEVEPAWNDALRPDSVGWEDFWNEEEDDPDMLLKDSVDQDQPGYDMTSNAHSRLDEIRDQRHMARVIAWEMPLLAKFAKPFAPPADDQPLRFRYTSYMGEFHPAEKKVVVEFCPEDFDLTPVQKDKLRKLVGPRLNPEKDIVRMSCEKFEHQAQNKRYLGDLVNKLLVEARDPTDTFEDIPLDTRHHKYKVRHKFPRAWIMTEKRMKRLEAKRAASFLLDQTMAKEGTLIDGVERYNAAMGMTAPSEPEKVPVMAPLHGR